MVPRDKPRLRTKLINGLGQGATSSLAALLAYMPNQMIGSKEGFWGAITAISVVQSELKAAKTTAADQFTGAGIGGVIALGTVLGLGQQVWAYALAVVLSVSVCWAANRPSASRLSGITATIVLLVPHTGSVETMFVSRVSEVAWGVCVAIVVVWVASHVTYEEVRVP